MPEVQCEFCGETVDTKALGSYKRVIGWVANRKQGGTNSVSLSSDLGAWAHGHCIDQQKSRGSVSWNQGEMF